MSAHAADKSYHHIFHKPLEPNTEVDNKRLFMFYESEFSREKEGKKDSWRQKRDCINTNFS